MTSAFWFFIGCCCGWVAFAVAATPSKPRHRRRIKEKRIDLRTVQFP